MKILVTGSNGFIGKNLIAELHNRGYDDIYEYHHNSDQHVLEEYAKDCGFVFHLAGVNRPDQEEDFLRGNYEFTLKIIDALKKSGNNAPILMTSTIQAILDNPYGRSKKMGEELLIKCCAESDRLCMIYRLQNVYGKWCRPNYNSVVATFCYNIARDLPITISDKKAEINLIYIDDVVSTLISAMKGGQKGARDGFYYVNAVSSVSLGKIAKKIQEFRDSRIDLSIPNMQDDFTRKLYSTYLSYIPEDQFSYPLKMNIDHRGSFTEMIRTKDRGQISVNIIKPDITKGNHWHHTKNEKFFVISGKGIIRFRKIGSNEVNTYEVSGDKLEVVDIAPGYTHNITNIGNVDMITIIWANELFDPQNPDTYFQEV